MSEHDDRLIRVGTINGWDDKQGAQIDWHGQAPSAMVNLYASVQQICRLNPQWQQSSQNTYLPPEYQIMEEPCQQESENSTWTKAATTLRGVLRNMTQRSSRKNDARKAKSPVPPANETERDKHMRLLNEAAAAVDVEPKRVTGKLTMQTGLAQPVIITDDGTVVDITNLQAVSMTRQASSFGIEVHAEFFLADEFRGEGY